MEKKEIKREVGRETPIQTLLKQKVKEEMSIMKEVFHEDKADLFELVERGWEWTKRRGRKARVSESRRKMDMIETWRRG